MQLSHYAARTLPRLEGIVADELRFGGRLTDVHAENGRVLFTGDENTLAWANLNLRCAERVLIRIGTFKAKTFDQLFEGVKALPWEQFIPADGAFPVKGHSLDSAFCTRFRTARRSSKRQSYRAWAQSTVKTWFDEIGGKYQIQFAIMHDVSRAVPRYLGCRFAQARLPRQQQRGAARETLAAAMVAGALARTRPVPRPVLRLGHDCD